MAFSSFIVTCISMTGLLCSILLGVQSCLYIYIQNFHQCENVQVNVQAYRNLSPWNKVFSLNPRRFFCSFSVFFLLLFYWALI